MKASETINAKQIRQDLVGFLRRVKTGQPITVIYRSKPFVTINDNPQREADSSPAGLKPGSPEAVRQSIAYAEALNKGRKPVFDPNKSTRQLYHEMLDNDPKYGAASRR